jgi:molybdate transport system permease protein
VDWTAFLLSLRLSFWTTALLLPLGILVGRTLAWRRLAAKGFLEALVFRSKAMWGYDPGV